MYRHLTTCEPPRPSLGKRVDLTDYKDVTQLDCVPQTSSLTDKVTDTPSTSNPSTQAVTVTEPTPTISTPNPFVSSQTNIDSSAIQGESHATF